MVLDVDPGHRRISLGLKQIMANPWETAKINIRSAASSRAR